MKSELVTTQKIHRWLCTIVLLFAAMISVMANTQNYYYNVKVQAWDGTNNRTGGGKVYVGTSQNDEPTGQTAEWVWDNWFTGRGHYEYTPFNKYSTSNNQNGDNVGPENAYASNTFYYYAIPDEDYVFSHWVDNNTANTDILSTKPFFFISRDFDGTENNRTKFLSYAIFKKQTGLVKVHNSDETRGTVSISNPDNVNGDEVTLTAYPDVSHGIKFLGWKKNNQDGENDGYYSKTNPLVLTVTNETAGTYWAYFSEPAEIMYCRIKNNKTGNFLSIYGDKSKRAANHMITIEYDKNKYERADGFKFDNCFKMISADNAQGNPTTVFSRQGHNQAQGVVSDINLTAQGVSYSDYVNSTSDYQLTMETSNGVTRIYTMRTITVGPHNQTIKSYLCDDGTGWPVMKGLDNASEEDIESSYWTVYVLNESTTKGAFGANTKAKYAKDGKYYTTMYTDFAYQLLDGVKAYYLVLSEEYYNSETNNVTFVELESDKVPARFPVVLETTVVQNSTSIEEVTNRLLPLPKSEVVASPLKGEEKAALQGYLSFNGKSEDGKTDVVNDKDHMYVLSSKNGTLGFYHSTKDNMSPNKAYLDISLYTTLEKVSNLAKTATFSFGQPFEDIDTPTNIKLSEEVVGDEDEPVFDLNGRKVAEGKDAEKLLRQGIYVKKGKKFVVK